MKSYGVQMVEQFLEGSLPLLGLFGWADAFGKSKYDPRETESLYIAAFLLNLRSNNVSPDDVQRELTALVEPTGGGI